MIVEVDEKTLERLEPLRKDGESLDALMNIFLDYIGFHTAEFLESKPKIICKVRPHSLENKYMIIGFENAWSEMFEDVEFDVYVFQNRLYIRSQPIKK